MACSLKVYSLEQQPQDQVSAASGLPAIARPRRVLLVAGEPSGDTLGAGLMQALKDLSCVPVEFSGVGGPQMEKQGLPTLFPIDDLAILGLAQVGPRIPKILSCINMVVRKALETDPDVIVLIDSSGFTDRVAARLKKRGVRAPLFKYVAPQVWASRPWRVNIIKRFYDHVLCLYPFEPPYFEQAGLAATFVGHPLTNKEISKYDPALFCERHGVMDRSKLLCMLPGSRLSEIKFLLPVFRKTIAALQKEIDYLQLVVPTTPNVHEIVNAEVKKWPLRSIVVQSEAEKYMAFRGARAALAASGTVSLELSMTGTPCIVAYKVGWVTAAVFRHLIKTPYLSLINIVAGEEIIPEFIQDRCQPQPMAKKLVGLMTNDDMHKEQRGRMLEAFAALRDDGEPPSIRAAQAILGHVETRPQGGSVV